MSGHELLTVAEMTIADRASVKAGVPSLDLMENAGCAVADAVAARWPVGTACVLCGPGNNGGDGYVAARHLKKHGWKILVEMRGEASALKGDAAEMFRRWDGETRPIARAREADVVVDALFGAGLSRSLDPDLREIVRALNESGVPVIAGDMPSGVSGDTGQKLDGACVRAALTVTFFRKKPGHLLMPGRILCGKEVIVADIGIPASVLKSIQPLAEENDPALWLQSYPWPHPSGHKYDRGHAVIVSGPAHATGAARLAARGALRAGAGLVSVASPPDAIAVNAAHLTAIMVKPFAGAKGLSALLADTRLNAVALGPGSGVGVRTRELVAAALASGAAIVLDADALTSFADDPQSLFARLGEECVITPHVGEFERIFPGLLKRGPSRLDAARTAAGAAGCTLILKGPDTVIAAPDGHARVNANAPAWLATAGAGDVLAGIVAGLLAQGMATFDAASAGVWLQGAAAAAFGPGLIAEDLPEELPHVLRALHASIEA